MPAEPNNSMVQYRWCFRMYSELSLNGERYQGTQRMGENELGGEIIRGKKNLIYSLGVIFGIFIQCNGFFCCTFPPLFHPHPMSCLHCKQQRGNNIVNSPKQRISLQMEIVKLSQEAKGIFPGSVSGSAGCQNCINEEKPSEALSSQGQSSRCNQSPDCCPGPAPLHLPPQEVKHCDPKEVSVDLVTWKGCLELKLQRFATSQL